MTSDDLALTFHQQSRGTVRNALTDAKKAGLIVVSGREEPGPRGGAPKPIWVPADLLDG